LDGARPSIQKELWHSNLNLGITSWGDVLVAAEVVEIAKGVTDFRQSNDSKRNNNSNSHSDNVARTNNWKGGLSKSPSSFPTTGKHSNRANNCCNFLKPGKNQSQSDCLSLPKIV
jgi:hypothetical protein